jgi:hypothetical protein
MDNSIRDLEHRLLLLHTFRAKSFNRFLQVFLRLTMSKNDNQHPFSHRYNFIAHFDFICNAASYIQERHHSGIAANDVALSIVFAKLNTILIFYEL